MSRFVVYALLDPRTRAVRYVGKSSSGMRRPRRHAVEARGGGKTHCDRWVRQLQASGFEYGIIILEDSGAGADLSARERWWIAFARAWGCALTNLTDGGEGKLGWVPSADTRARWRVTLARDDVRARKSAAAKAAQARPEVRQHQSVGARIALARPGVKAARDAALRCALARPDVIARRAAARAALVASSDVQARRLAGLARWSSGTVAELYRQLIRSGLDNAAVYERVVAERGAENAGPKTNAAWYRGELRRKERVSKEAR